MSQQKAFENEAENDANVRAFGKISSPACFQQHLFSRLKAEIVTPEKAAPFAMHHCSCCWKCDRAHHQQKGPS